MSVARVAISVPTDVLARARLAVKQGRAPSLSAYVTLALEEMTRLDDDFDAHLDAALERSGGPMTEEERRTTDELMDRFEGPRRAPR